MLKKLVNLLSKSALLISIDGKLKDLNTVIDKDCSVKIFTSKDKEGLETIRHDTAHILANGCSRIISRNSSYNWAL